MRLVDVLDPLLGPLQQASLGSVAIAVPEPIPDARPVADGRPYGQGVRCADEEAERQTVGEAGEGHTQADQEAVTQGRGRSGGRPGEDVSALDKRIIEHLQADGRRPFTQIAADLGVSEAAVRARTNRLVERGVLQVVGVTDPLRLGFQQMAMIGVKCEAERLMAVAEEIGVPQVDYVVVTAGSTTCWWRPSRRTTRPSGFLADRLRRVEGVRETETFVYLRMVKQTTSGAPARRRRRRVLSRATVRASLAPVPARTPTPHRRGVGWPTPGCPSDAWGTSGPGRSVA